jgi:hypothetical protein
MTLYAFLLSLTFALPTADPDYLTPNAENMP